MGVVEMMSLSALGRGRENYYLNLAREDYYTQGGEAPGEWLGHGALALGLGSEVEGNDLRNLLHGKSSDGTVALVQERRGAERQMGWDLTFSAPKSVSVLWSQTESGEDRQRIQQAHRAAVASTLQYLEGHVTYSRRTRGGAVHERAGLVMAAFSHQTSRARDPQLHTHVIVTNLGVRRDGTTGTIVSKPFYQQKMVLGAMYRAELARNLTEYLGVRWEAHRTWHEIAGVPRKVMDHFSKRRQQIEAALEERGLSSPEAAAVAALNTRNKKDLTPRPREELFREWHEAGKAVGWGPREAKAFLREAARTRNLIQSRGPGPVELEPEELAWLQGRWDSSPLAETHQPTEENITMVAREELVEARDIFTDLRPLPEPPQSAVPDQDEHVRSVFAEWDEEPGFQRPLGWFRRNMLELRVGWAMDSLTKSSNYVTEYELLRRTLDLGFGEGYTWAQTFERVHSFLTERKEIVRLGEVPEGVAYTTREVLECERKLLALADESRREWTSPPSEYKVDYLIASFERASVLEKPGFSLTDEQRRAIKHITREPGSLQLLRGFAGTGKTTILTAARQIWEDQGYKVYGATLAGAAGKRLQAETGIETGTVASRLWHLTQGRWDHEWEQIGRALVGKKRIDFRDRFWTLDKKSVLVVDEASMVGTRELQTLLNAARRAGAKVVLVGDNRQLQAIDRGGAFAALGERLGYAELTEIRRQREEWARNAVRAVVAGQASEALAAYAKRGQFTVTHDRDEAMEALIQQWTGRGGLARPDEHLIIASVREETAVLNERAQEMRKRAGVVRGGGININGQRVHLGDRVVFTRKNKLFKVENGDMGRVTFVSRLTQNIRVRLDDGNTVTIPLLRYNDIQLGYAITAHKAQGATVENAYVLLGGRMQDRELSYVQLSRARGETRLFVQDGHDDRRLKSLVDAMSRSREKQLASRVAEAEQERKRAEILGTQAQESPQQQQEEQQRVGPRLRM